MNLEFVPSAANFVLVRVGDGDKIFGALLPRPHRQHAQLQAAGVDSFPWERWIKNRRLIADCAARSREGPPSRLRTEAPP
jgi:hypothetical protein